MRPFQLFTLTLVASAPLSLVPSASAQPALPGPPSGPQLWRNIGPDRGGRSLTVAGSSARPNEYFFRAVGGGVRPLASDPPHT